MSLVLDYPATRPPGWAEDEWLALIQSLTRRKFIVGSMALGVVTILPGCGGRDSNRSESDVATRLINTAKGSIAVPVSPRRIVCLDFVTMSDLYDVGITPVGVPTKSTDLVVEAATQKFRTIDTIDNSSGEPNLEKIVSLTPDLIVGTTLRESAYQHLVKIAPTALFTWKQAGVNWEEVDQHVADAVGHRQQLTSLKQQYEERARSIRDRYGAILATYRWNLISADPGTWYLYSPRSSHGRVLADAGAQFGNQASQMSAGFQQLSYEQIKALDDAEVVGIGVANDGTVEPATQQLMNESNFRLLNAARQHHVFTLYPFFPCSYQAALALLGAFEAACKQLQESNE